MELFKVLQIIYTILDFILTKICGYSLRDGWTEDKKRAKNKGQGHLMSILSRKKDNLLAPRHFLIYPSSFILKHENYLDSIDYVLNNDNVVLMGLTKTKVVDMASKFEQD